MVRRKVLYVPTDYDAITDADELLAAIAKLAAEQADRASLIKQLAVHAVRDLGAPRVGTAIAAAISRPTLNAWLASDELEHS